MGQSTCLTPGCTNKSYRRNRCTTHYRHGLELGEFGKKVPCKWPDCKKFSSSNGFCHNHRKRANGLNNFSTPWVDEANRKELKPCSWPDCERSRSSVYSKFCHRCYQRARRVNNFDDPWVTWRAYGVPDVVPICKWEGCERESAYAGYCRRDYSRAKVLKNFIDPWVDWITDGECVVCGTRWSGARNRNKRVCSRSCHMKAWEIENPERARENKMNATRRRRARLAGVEVEYFTIADIRLVHGDDCYLCNGPINYSLRFPHPKSPSVDHIKPISAGGSHTVENCAMTHLKCNNRKSADEVDVVPDGTLFSSSV